MQCPIEVYTASPGSIRASRSPTIRSMTEQWWSPVAADCACIAKRSISAPLSPARPSASKKSTRASA